MKRPSYLMILVSVLLVTFVAAPAAQAQHVDFEKETHFRCYVISEQTPSPARTVTLEDQFGPRTLEVVGARVLLVPTQKLVGDLPFPTKLNHYWCYEANGPRVHQRVTLDDQFGTDRVRVEQPTLFCNPVEKTVGGVTTRIEEREVHLTCYDIKAPQRTESATFGVFNQFERDRFTVTSFNLLCVPSEKLSFTPIS